MRPARVIWVCWCLLWVLVWLGGAGHAVSANDRCQAANQLAGMHVLACQGGGPVLFALAAAAASAAAIALPVGR